jgi:hypothetical protein
MNGRQNNGIPVQGSQNNGIPMQCRVIRITVFLCRVVRKTVFLCRVVRTTVFICRVVRTTVFLCRVVRTTVDQSRFIRTTVIPLTDVTGATVVTLKIVIGQAILCQVVLSSNVYFQLRKKRGGGRGEGGRPEVQAGTSNEELHSK